MWRSVDCWVGLGELVVVEIRRVDGTCVVSGKIIYIISVLRDSTESVWLTQIVPI